MLVNMLFRLFPIFFGKYIFSFLKRFSQMVLIPENLLIHQFYPPLFHLKSTPRAKLLLLHH